MEPTTGCREHRQAITDDSARGRHHSDDRTALAYVYDGPSLQAILFASLELSTIEP